MTQQQAPPNNVLQQTLKKGEASGAPLNNKQKAFVLRKQGEELKDHILILVEKQMDTTLSILRRWLKS